MSGWPAICHAVDQPQPVSGRSISRGLQKPHAVGPSEFWSAYIATLQRSYLPKRCKYIFPKVTTTESREYMQFVDLT